jgi:ABC-type glycerol-3-phosphate transport system substrate-binding protein
MKKTVLILAAAFVAVACSGKSAAPATEAVEETQEVQVEAIDSTAVEVEAEWESTEEVETTEEVTEETTTEEASN